MNCPQSKVRKWEQSSRLLSMVIQVEKRTVRQGFFSNNKVALFHFLLLHITTEAMGIWRSAGVFPVAKRQKEMRAQRPLNARQPANEHRRVLAVRCLFFVRHLLFLRQLAFELNFKNFTGIKLKSLFISLSTRSVFFSFLRVFVLLCNLRLS